MTSIQMALCAACALTVSVGQVLFKYAANRLAAVENNYWDTQFLTILFAAMAVYASTSLGWIWLLTRIELSQAYAWLALTYVAVPLAAVLLFKEQVSVQSWFGLSLIAIGIWVSTQ